MIMRKLILAAVLVIACSVSSSAQSGYAIKAPTGYQGHLEHENIFFPNSHNGMAFSTTHGFYYSDNVFVGLGLSVNLYDEDGMSMVPFYASAKYLFNPVAKVSPTLQMRLGSFLYEDDVNPYTDLALGLRFASHHDFAFSLMLSGTYLGSFSYGRGYYDSHSGEYSIEKTEYPFSFSLRIGIEW